MFDIQPPRPRRPSVNLSSSNAQNQPVRAIYSENNPLELSSIPEQIGPTDAKQRPFRIRRNFLIRWLKKEWTVKRVILWLLAFLALGLIVFGVRAFMNVNKTFKGSTLGAIVGAVTPDKPLKTDQYGNTNILMLGTMESDPNHPGALRTNSMIVVSVNKARQTITLLSIPRDLWVKGDQSNPCVAGYEYKINATYECELGTHFKDGTLSGLSPIQNDELTAESKTAAIVGKTVGVDVNYIVHMNLTVVQQVVDAVGGIDITIQSPDPRGILDRNFDWRCNYKCYLVKYPNGPVQLNGAQAMWLSQARNDTVAPQYVGYGLPRSNFDREVNQRKIVMATKDKAANIGFLANPINMSNLLDAMGNNLHTTIDSSEIKSFADEVKAIPSSNITSIDIQSVAPNILTTGWSPDRTQSIVEPTAGLYDYRALQTFMHQVIRGNASLIQEAAKIDVLNSSGKSGAAAQEASQLQNDGFTIGSIASAPSSYSSSAKYTLYDLSQGKDPATLAALQKELGVTTTASTLPSGVTSSAPFVIVLGDQGSSGGSSGQ